MRFRKRPVVVEAEQFIGVGDSLSPKFRAAVVDVGIPRAPLPTIKTLEGVFRVNEGDWIVCGVKGEFYSCKPDIFEATYEAVQDAPHP